MKIKRTLYKYLSRLDIHTLEVLKKSFSSTIVKVAGMIIGFLVSIFLGRTIGADGLGIINLSQRIVNILIVVGLFGIQQVIIKEVAIAHNKKDYIHIGNVMRSAYLINGCITLILSVILILLSPWLANSVFMEPRLTYPLIIALVVMTPQVFSRIYSSGLVGYRKIWQSNLVDKTLSLATTGFLLLLIYLIGYDITVINVAICFAIGRVGVTITVGFYWNSIFKTKNKKRLIGSQLMKTSVPLFFVAISGIIMTNADAIILGTIVSADEVGLYTVAARIALLTSFFLQITNSAVAPKIAALYENNKFRELRIMLRRVTLTLGILAAGFLLFFIVFGKYLLSIWGEEFIRAYWILVILSVGQFVNTATGAVGIVLIMTNHEKIQRNISVIFTIFYLIFNIVLGRIYGIIGIALGTASVMIAINLTKLYYVKTKTGFHLISLTTK